MSTLFNGKRFARSNRSGICINVVLSSKRYSGEFVKVYEIKINNEVKDKNFLAGAKAKMLYLKRMVGERFLYWD
ncbi:hypothetical protein [Clostridium gasigenes]|uniref:hypothetical protein n=1 Tax=Clostridium gasigenes TaxID=94869 RepID=UPI00209BB5EB|nr:hypothetical protein [Clostridium gasigenes]